MGKYALILVMAMIFGMIVYGQSIRKNLYSSQVEMVETYRYNQARNIAQSAAMMVVKKMQHIDDDTFNPEKNDRITIPSSENAFNNWDKVNGDYRLEIKNDGDTLITLKATGRAESNEYTVEVTMSRNHGQWNPDLPWAVFAENSIDLYPSASINGNAGTNATGSDKVVLDWSTNITDSLYIGPGANSDYTINQRSDDQVGEGIANLPSPVEYELPVFPDFPDKLPGGSAIIASGSTGDITVTPDSYNQTYIPELNISGNRTVTINTGSEDQQLHVGKLNIEQGHLNIEGEGELELLIEDEIQMKGSSTFNAGNSQDKVFTYYKGREKVELNEIDFSGATNFNGSLYAQNADVVIGGSGGIQGHIITGGANVDITGNASAITRAIFAPDAHVKVSGSGYVNGALIGETVEASGGAEIIFSNDFDDSLPDLENKEEGFSVQSWY